MAVLDPLSHLSGRRNFFCGFPYARAGTWFMHSHQIFWGHLPQPPPEFEKGEELGQINEQSWQIKGEIGPNSECVPFALGDREGRPLLGRQDVPLAPRLPQVLQRGCEFGSKSDPKKKPVPNSTVSRKTESNLIRLFNIFEILVLYFYNKKYYWKDIQFYRILTGFGSDKFSNRDPVTPAAPKFS